MKLTSEKALEMIEKDKGKTNSDRWIYHSICVGNTAGKIAEALSEKGIDIDIDKTISLGYVHDIGKRFNESGGVFPHAINGYNYIKELGYDEEYAGICIKHSFLNNDIDCISNDRDETDKSNPNYNFQVDILVSMNAWKLSKTAKLILATIYRDYLANETQNQKIKRVEQQQNQKLEDIARQKYNPDDIFKK